MKLIKNNFIPAKGFKAMTIWPFIFYKGEKPSISAENHENIHGAQQKELFLIIFYIIYFIEYGVKYLILRNADKAYRAISFEREAYSNEFNTNYIKDRKCFAMWRKSH